MSYVIGIGVLIEGKPFNRLRDVALRLAGKTGNWHGLSQPPHVTIKRPFEVKDIGTITKVAEIMEKLAAGQAPFKLKLGTHKSFGRQVLYASVEENKTLQTLHTQLLKQLAPYYKQVDELEGDAVVFHSTLALDLQGEEHKKGLAELDTKNPNIPDDVQVSNLGLFLGINNLQEWVVIRSSPLLKGSVRHDKLRN